MIWLAWAWLFFVWGGFGYVVFGLGYSGWWFALAVYLSSVTIRGSK